MSSDIDFKLNDSLAILAKELESDVYSRFQHVLTLLQQDLDSLLDNRVFVSGLMIILSSPKGLSSSNISVLEKELSKAMITVKQTEIEEILTKLERK